MKRLTLIAVLLLSYALLGVATGRSVYLRWEEPREHQVYSHESEAVVAAVFWPAVWLYRAGVAAGDWWEGEKPHEET